MLISWSIYYQLVQYSQIFDASTVATKSVREKIVKPWFDRRKECWVAGWVAGCWCCSMVDWSRWFTIHVNLQSRKSVPERFPTKYCNNFSILVSYNSSWYVVFYPQHFDIDAYRCKRKIRLRTKRPNLKSSNLLMFLLMSKAPPTSMGPPPVGGP